MKSRGWVRWNEGDRLGWREEERGVKEVRREQKEWWVSRRMERINRRWVRDGKKERSLSGRKEGLWPCYEENLGSPWITHTTCHKAAIPHISAVQCVCVCVCRLSGEWSHRGNWIRTWKQQGNRFGVRWSNAAGKATVTLRFQLKGKETAFFFFWVSGTAVSRELTLHGLSQEPQLQVQHSAGLFNIHFFSISQCLLFLQPPPYPMGLCFYEHTRLIFFLFLFHFTLCKLQSHSGVKRWQNGWKLIQTRPLTRKSRLK